MDGIMDGAIARRTCIMAMIAKARVAASCRYGMGARWEASLRVDSMRAGMSMAGPGGLN